MHVSIALRVRIYTTAETFDLVSTIAAYLTEDLVLYECENIWTLQGRGDRRGVEKLRYEELHNLCPSPNIIRVNNSRRMRWAANIVRIVLTRNIHKMLVGRGEEANWNAWM